MQAEAPAVERLQVETTWHALVPRLLRGHESHMVAEVGVWRGTLSSRILRECVQVRRLILVDAWTVVYGHDPERDQWLVFGPGTTQQEMDEAYQGVMAKMQYYGPRVTVLKMPSLEGAATVPDGSLDAVIIDALHTYHACKEDILAWRPKLRPGGLMIGDDYSEWYPGVQAAVEELFGEQHRVLGQTWWTILKEEDHVRMDRSAH